MWVFSKQQNDYKTKTFISVSIEYLGAQKFSINFDLEHNVRMFNEKNAEIEKTRFEQIVEVYWRDASFCINLFATYPKSDSPVITPKVRAKI